MQKFYVGILLLSLNTVSLAATQDMAVEEEIAEILEVANGISDKVVKVSHYMKTIEFYRGEEYTHYSGIKLHDIANNRHGYLISDRENSRHNGAWLCGKLGHLDETFTYVSEFKGIRPLFSGARLSFSFGENDKDLLRADGKIKRGDGYVSGVSCRGSLKKSESNKVNESVGIKEIQDMSPQLEIPGNLTQTL